MKKRHPSVRRYRSVLIIGLGVAFIAVLLTAGPFLLKDTGLLRNSGRLARDEGASSRGFPIPNYLITCERVLCAALSIPPEQRLPVTRAGTSPSVTLSKPNMDVRDAFMALTEQTGALFAIHGSLANLRVNTDYQDTPAATVFKNLTAQLNATWETDSLGTRDVYRIFPKPEPAKGYFGTLAPSQRTLIICLSLVVAVRLLLRGINNYRGTVKSFEKKDRNGRS